MEQSTAATVTTSRRRRGGRPVKPAVERRSIKITVALNPVEAEQLGLKLAETGADAPSYIRAAAFNSHIQVVPTLNRQAYSELARLAGNLNQLVRHCNNGTGGIVAGEQLAPAIQRLHADVQKLRGQLLGA